MGVNLPLEHHTPFPGIMCSPLLWRLSARSGQVQAYKPQHRVRPLNITTFVSRAPYATDATELSSSLWTITKSLLCTGQTRDSSVGIETGYGLDPGSILGRGKRFVPSPHRPDRLWGPTKLLSDGYRGFFPTGQSGRGVKLTTPHLLPRSRMMELYLHSPLHLHGDNFTLHTLDKELISSEHDMFRLLCGHIHKVIFYIPWVDTILFVLSF
jgi:hypothetical protein